MSSVFVNNKKRHENQLKFKIYTISDQNLVHLERRDIIFKLFESRLSLKKAKILLLSLPQGHLTFFPGKK